MPESIATPFFGSSVARLDIPELADSWLDVQSDANETGK
jgi:hypothetical protein